MKLLLNYPVYFPKIFTSLMLGQQPSSNPVTVIFT
jgi:hypothetical protein